MILKPQGIKGELKVKPTTQENLQKITDLEIDRVSYPVKNICERQGYLYIILSGIDDRNAAELFRNKEIFTDISEEPPTEGSYYVADLIGCDVFKNDKLLGKISVILSHGAADVIVVSGEKEIMFPHIKGIFKTVDLKAKHINLDEKIFGQVTDEI